MGITKKFVERGRWNVQAVKGGAKKIVGRVTGNRRLRAEGRGDQAKSHAKQAWAKIKDAFKR
jgi:uncharacterized protein YjbJ (UPF0337 family)